MNWNRKNVRTLLHEKSETINKINSETTYVKKTRTLPTSDSQTESAFIFPTKTLVSTSSVKPENVILKIGHGSSSNSASSNQTPRYKKIIGNKQGFSPEAEVKYLEQKFIQCNIPRTDQKIEAALPEQLTPLLGMLMNLTQKKDVSKESNDVRNIIRKISTLLTDMSAHPISKIHEFRTDYTKQCQEISDKLCSLIKSHSDGSRKIYERILKDITKAETRIDEKNETIATLKQKMEEDRLNDKIKTSDLVIRLKNRLVQHQMLKDELKFNAGQFKKYKKILTEKEFEKQKLTTQLARLKKKAAKIKVKAKVEDEANFTTVNEEVYFGGMFTKQVRTNHDKNKASFKTEKSADAKKVTKNI